MTTEYWMVDPLRPEPEIIGRAVRLLRQEELVAFPTETVYGVGALAFSPSAVKKIFWAKNRPAQSPLLIHLSNMNQIETVVPSITGEARILMEKFWPGPLSLIMEAGREVPDEVRGGMPTVGLRMPSHQVARALIEASGPLAATSANLSGRPSPVRADDVRTDLDGRIAGVLDGGPTGLGLESTVLDLSVRPYRVLRRGGIAVEELEEVLNTRIRVAADKEKDTPHYRTGSRVFISTDEREFQVLVNKTLMSGGRAGVVYNDLMPRPKINPDAAALIKEYSICFEQDSIGLYPLLREAEAEGIDILIFSPLPASSTPVAAAVIDRIRAAAQPAWGWGGPASRGDG